MFLDELVRVRPASTWPGGRVDRSRWPAWSPSFAVPPTDDTMSEPLRRAAAHRLARLTREHRAGRVRVPSADPATWWGTRGLTEGQSPLRPSDEPVRLSASALTSLEQCPTKWFLESEAGGARGLDPGAGFRQHRPRPSRSGRPRRAGGGPGSGRPPDGSRRRRLGADPVPDAVVQRSRARRGPQSPGRFLTWHLRPDARTVIGTERRITTTVDLPDGQQVVLPRLRRPSRGRRRGPGCGDRPQDRQVRTDG